MTTMKRDPITKRDPISLVVPGDAGGCPPRPPAPPVLRLVNAPATRSHRTAAVSSASRPLSPTLPRFAQVESIGRCNLACRMCAVNHRPADQQGQAISVAQFDALLDQLPTLQELHLQGLGEPLLHPDFFTLVEHAVARGIRVSANTNGTLITSSRARRCVTSGLTALSISLDGAYAATYEPIRRQASFAKVTRNISRLVHARRALQSDTPALRLVTVLMRSNLADLPALVELAADLGVHELQVQRLASDLAEPSLPPRYQPVQSYLRDAELRGSDLAEASNLFASARERAARLGVRLHLPRLTPAQPARPVRRNGAEAGPRAGGTPRCNWPFDKLYVTAGGDALPCCMVGTSDRACLGNVIEQGIEAVWRGDAARQWRAGLLSDAPGAVCRGCALYRGTF